MAALSMIGVPSSAGSYAAGQDRAPRALREAGLVAALTAAGVDVRDAGDRLALVGVDPTRSTDFERDQVAALGISVTTQAALIADPAVAAAAAAALRALPEVPFAAHVDVDVLDFVDAPSRRTPADATSARRSTSSPRPCVSWWPIRGGARSRSARSTRPAAPATRAC